MKEIIQHFPDFLRFLALGVCAVVIAVAWRTERI